jgi:6-pyruvoyltetrahydropterin/6-carboxytetrahydropterin synthase
MPGSPDASATQVRSVAEATRPDATAIRIAKRFRVSCSHWLLVGDERHWCGHNWAVELGLAALQLNQVGMVFDYGELDGVKRLLDAEIDHRHLDDVLDGPPATCEDIAQRVAGFVHQRLATDASLSFAPLVCDVGVEDLWHGDLPRAWRSVDRVWRFHAGHRLAGLPEGHQCGRDHGHGFAVGAEVDPAMGGAPGDVLRPAGALVRQRLHHQSLNAVLGGLNPTAEHLVWFLATQFTQKLQIPGLWRVVVAETPETLAEWRSQEYRP